MKRRQFLTVSAATVGGALVYTLDRRPYVVSAQDKPVRVPLRFFTEAEALDVAAAAARILPNDEAGPGANEAGVVIYIDRQLAGPYGRDRYRYTQGPFENGIPEQGYQGKATPREIYREGVRKIAGIAKLAAAEQDATLKQIETTSFFTLVKTHTIEGMFCDPMHGGNIDMIGWQLIGFPGPRMTYFEEVDSHYGNPFRPKPQSLRQIVGRPVKASEDEA
ncbi:MAG: gluconate 2-dehydrogenase subunit 3 family protein [Bryobacterales bacterium]|nr:gluconate 2-dehydrogenase subunit 3 family protein [Bryobacterales bacterium]